MLVYYKVEAQQTLHILVSLNAETGGCTEGVPNPGCLFIGHGPKTLPVTWLTGNQRSLIFLIKNSPDQVEGYLDYLQVDLHGETTWA
jgi:hypothetical protein